MSVGDGDRAEPSELTALECLAAKENARRSANRAHDTNTRRSSLRPWKKSARRLCLGEAASEAVCGAAGAGAHTHMNVHFLHRFLAMQDQCRIARDRWNL